MKIKIGFKGGEIYPIGGDVSIELDMIDTYHLYKAMDEYYNSMCTVRYWKQDTLESGRCIEAYLTIKSAIWYIKEGWFIDAIITPEEN